MKHNIFVITVGLILEYGFIILSLLFTFLSQFSSREFGGVHGFPERMSETIPTSHQS